MDDNQNDKLADQLSLYLVTGRELLPPGKVSLNFGHCRLRQADANNLRDGRTTMKVSRRYVDSTLYEFSILNWLSALSSD
jgi:hypothetical protein